MNKNRFLKDLEKKLAVLSEDERKDTINEYSDIIDEKVKHGKTEEDAVKEFGDINELSKEILKAYKIDPNYRSNDFSEKTNDFIKTSEDLIKKGAKKLSDVTEEVVDSFKKNDHELNVNDVFEIIIKIVLVLLCLAVLKVPFYLLSGIGSGIFSSSVFPLGGFTSIAWKILIEVIYFAVCVLLIMAVVNNYTKKPKVVVVKKSINKDKVIDNKIVEEKIIVKQKQYNGNNHVDAFGGFLLTLIKMWCVILVLFPLWCTEIGLVVGICVTIYLIIKGLAVYGVLLLLIGAAGMFGYFSDVIYRLLFTKKSIHIYPVFINIVLIVIGGLMTFNYAVNLKYINDLPNSIELRTDIYEKTIDGNISIYNNIDKYIDNTLENNVLRFEITYYDDIYNIDEPIFRESNGEKFIQINKHYENREFSFNNGFNKLILDNLKEDRIYNYGLIDSVNIKVYSNEFTSNLYN